MKDSEYFEEARKKTNKKQNLKTVMPLRSGKIEKKVVKVLRLRSGKNEKKVVKKSSQNKKGSKNKERKRTTCIRLSLRNRASPLQFSKCIQQLKPQQVEEVKRLGFGKMLNFVTDGIPAKLGHFLVDKFDCQLMQIDLGDIKIKVDCNAIHRLLGIPNKGTVLKTVNTKKENMTILGNKWKAMYPEDQISPSEIVNRIQTSGDASLLFQIDFIMLFVTSVITCRSNGKCKTELLYRISEDLDLKDINWCAYVVDKLSCCKDKWDRSNPQSFFTGAVTILVLLYVESMSCNEMTIKYWTKDMLSMRENQEIVNGGFGRCISRTKEVQKNWQQSVEVHSMEIQQQSVEEEYLNIKNQLETFLRKEKELVKLVKQFGSILEDKRDFNPLEKDGNDEEEGDEGAANDGMNHANIEKSNDEEEGDDGSVNDGMNHDNFSKLWSRPNPKLVYKRRKRKFRGVNQDIEKKAIENKAPLGHHCKRPDRRFGSTSQLEHIQEAAEQIVHMSVKEPNNCLKTVEAECFVKSAKGAPLTEDAEQLSDEDPTDEMANTAAILSQLRAGSSVQ